MAGKTHAQIVTQLRIQHGIHTSETAIRRAKKRWEQRTGNKLVAPVRQKLGEPAVTISGDKATVQGGNPKDVTEITPEELMRKHDLDPEEWDIDKVVVNKWDANAGDGEKMPLYQLKLWLVRKKPINFVFPARVPSDYKAPDLGQYAHHRGEYGRQLIVVAGDQQAPYQDDLMHQTFVQFLHSVKPDGMILTGDTVDFPDISRHRDNPEWHVPMQECIDIGYLLLRDYRQAAEKMWIKKLLGNHDERIRTELLNRAERLYGIRRAQVPGEAEEESVVGVKNLLRLDELNIELIDPQGNYDQAQVEITPELAVRHGWLTGDKAALQSIKRLNHSLIFGHTHRQSMVHQTTYGMDRVPRPIVGVETGCMCRIEGGLGYAVDPDWVNGFVTVEVWDDGHFVIDFAKFDRGVLTWRDRRF